ncbi:MAG: ribosomal protein S18-alanine N-acetyltransferase [Acetatifactor sp.]|nr:ribosomal protein S18-alanine N-acetyltransferase [Acetatifactor sp.]
MEIKVRELREGDISELSRIEAESFSLPWSAEAFRELLLRPYCNYLVALADGKLAGCCGYTDSFHEATIDNVVVALEYRNCGIAQIMLKKLMEQGAASGIEAYTLEVRVSNRAAIHIYEKLGFRSEGIRPGFYEKPVEDAMIMWKRNKI